jgi:putative transposase
LERARADVTAIRAEYSLSERQACGLVGVAVSSCRYAPRRLGSDAALRARLIGLAQQHPRWGYRRLCVMVRRVEVANHKRVHRLYREAGLSLRRKKRKRIARQRPAVVLAQAANQEWAMDFVNDAMASGRHIRVLTVIDVFTRECLALETDTSIGSLRVVRVLERIIEERGTPQRIRSDNGPEFTSRAYLAWAVEGQIELVHIRPGKPIENAYIESFNGRLREECLNVSWFRNLFDARRQIDAWRDHYNRQRPHSALDYRTPEQFALACASAGFSRTEVRQGGSNAAPSPHTPLPATNGAQCDEACRMI